MPARRASCYEEIPMGHNRYLRIRLLPKGRSKNVLSVIIQVRDAARLVRSTPEIPIAVAECIGVAAQALAYRARTARKPRPTTRKG